MRILALALAEFLLAPVHTALDHAAMIATFELLHVNRMKEKMLASPAMVGGTWYFRTHGPLMAVGK